MIRVGPGRSGKWLILTVALGLSAPILGAADVLSSRCDQSAHRHFQRVLGRDGFRSLRVFLRSAGFLRSIRSDQIRPCRFKNFQV